MTVTVVNIVPRAYAANSQTTVYTATNCKTIIDKFTVTNNTASAATFAVNLVASAGSATAANKVLPTTTIVAGQVYECPSLVGQVLESGGFISTLASAASTLTISASGREIT